MAIENKTEPSLTQSKRTDPHLQASSIEEFGRMLEDKKSFDYSKTGTYWRNGFPSLDAAEKHVKELMGANDHQALLLVNSGMAAVRTAIEITSPTAGDFILYGERMYKNSRRYCGIILPQRGINSVPADSELMRDISQKLERIETQLNGESDKKLKLVFFETFSNGIMMPVLDVESFLCIPTLHRLNPTIILDNTMCINSQSGITETIEKFPDLRIIVVESITKSYISNEDNGGLLITSNKELSRQLQEMRRTDGSTPGPSLTSTIEHFIPPTKEQFDWENKTIAENTYTIAVACAEASEQSSRFSVSHPGLESELARRITPPNGAAVPVFFICWPKNGLTARGIAETLEKHGALKDCFIAESFGFPKTSILFDPDSEYVRVAGGLENPKKAQEIAEAFKKALSSL
ncbi:MAG: PLP-dependent transferase [Candidatus Levybacteria bacterium]|nr:PLP-dependent transferase [Candidatus Levybacteria bacterium]